MADNSLIPYQYFCTDTLSAHDGFQAWQQLSQMLELPYLHKPQDIDRFYAQAHGYMLSNIAFVHTYSIAQNFIRSPELVAQSGLDHVYVTVFLSGDYEMVTEDRKTTIQAGDIQFIDLNRSYKMLLKPMSEHYENIMLIMPRAKLVELLPNIDFLHQAILRSGTAMNKLLKDFLLSLRDTVSKFTLEQAERTSSALLALVAACFSDKEVIYHNRDYATNRHLFPAIKQFIYQQISNSELSPELIAKQFHISPTKLSRVCKDFGGVTTIIRRCRLLNAYKLLNLTDTLSIQHICHQVGFNHQDTFTRAFKKEFGVLPSKLKSRKVNKTITTDSLEQGLDVWRDWANHYIN